MVPRGSRSDGLWKEFMHSSEPIILRADEIGQIPSKIAVCPRTSHEVSGLFPQTILCKIARIYGGA